MPVRASKTCTNSGPTSSCNLSPSRGRVRGESRATISARAPGRAGSSSSWTPVISTVQALRQRFRARRPRHRAALPGRLTAPDRTGLRTPTKPRPPGRAGRQSVNNSKLAPAATGWAGETGGITKRASPSSSMSQLDQNGSSARSQKMGVGIDSLSVVWVPLEVIVWSGRGRVAAVAHVADDGAGSHRTESLVA